MTSEEQIKLAIEDCVKKIEKLFYTDDCWQMSPIANSVTSHNISKKEKIKKLLTDLCEYTQSLSPTSREHNIEILKLAVEGKDLDTDLMTLARDMRNFVNEF